MRAFLVKFPHAQVLIPDAGSEDFLALFESEPEYPKCPAARKLDWVASLATGRSGPGSSSCCAARGNSLSSVAAPFYHSTRRPYCTCPTKVSELV